MDKKLQIRLATLDDMKDVFELSNDDVVRENSINQNKIRWEDHVKWFENKISDDNSVFYIASYLDSFVGYARLDKSLKENKWIITIHLKSDFRNRGLGKILINLILSKNDDKEILSYVKIGNIASEKMFVSCGFQFREIEVIHGVKYNCFVFKPRLSIIAISNKLYANSNILGKENMIYVFDRNDLTFENLKKINPKYIFFPHWSYIISDEILENFNCIIFHMTDLPFGRGGSPLQNLIERGIYKTKISAIKCTKKIDAGDVYMKKDFDISVGSASEIYTKCGKIISEMIDYILSHDITPIPQSGVVVEFKRRTPQQSNIQSLKNIQKIYDYIRMLDADGYPKAFLVNNDIKFEFSNAKYIDGRLIAEVEIKENYER